MDRAIWLRRVLIATLILTATTLTFPSAGANASPVVGSASSTTTHRSAICPVEWRKGTFYVKKLIRCAAHHYGVNADKAVSVAFRESRFHPKAYNSWSCAKGIYQHLCKYWPERADTYGFDDWSAYNARANVMVTVRMVKKHGWSPWGY